MTVRYRSVLVVFILLLFLPFLPNGAGRITADAGSIENLKDAWFFYDPNAGEGMKKKKAEKLLTYLKAVSSDESIAIPGTIYCELDDDSEKTYIFNIPLMLYKSGIVTISLINTQSDIIIFRKTFRITDKIIKKLWERCCRSGLRNTYYGETSLIARGWKGDKIKICIGKKQWIKTVPASGEVAFKIPVQKTGTVIEATHYKYGSTLKYSEKYTIEDDWLQYDADGVKVSSKKITVSVWFAKKGDVIKIKAGGKTYSKKVRKNYDGYDKEDIFVWTQKVKPLKKGSSVEIYIYNRFKQVRGKREIKVE